MVDFCVIVHAGAGYHSKQREKDYSTLCSQACQKAADVFQHSSSDTKAISATVAAVSHLENSYMTNAGFGSNLTIEKEVECDAGIMCGSTLRFAAVGSLSCIKNPIQVVEHLIFRQISQPVSSLGRVFPSLLVGKGALSYAGKVAGFQKLEHSDLVSQGALYNWRKYSKFLQEIEPPEIEQDHCHSSRPSGKHAKCPRVLHPLDTVGAVCIDSSGNIATATSSGGIAMKCPGRLGQACVYGAGSWAENASFGNGRTSNGVGVVTSGTGEQLIRTQLAQRCAQRLLEDSQPAPLAIGDSLSFDFLNSRYLQGDPAQRYAGVAGCVWQANSSTSGSNNALSRSTVEVFFGHTTQSMGLAYFIGGGTMMSPKAFISRKPANQPFTVGTYAFSNSQHS